MRLLLATNNAGKIREFRALLAGESFAVTTPGEEGLSLDVDETGSTLADNATLKAVAFRELTGLPTLADDSGLFVDHLGGEPGVHSARYAGPGATDADRVALLLRRLAGVPDERRTACFRAVIAVALPGRAVEYSYGECCGIIGQVGVGQFGFGYDPVFRFPELGKSMAELGSTEKNGVSHRSRALRAAIPFLRQHLEGESVGAS